MPTLMTDIELPLGQALWRLPPKAGQAQPGPLDESRPRSFAALAKVLASASAGHYGLAVKVRDENRVVGTWDLELYPRDVAGALICNTRARLQLCASTSNDTFSNCAFLVVTRWPSNVRDREQSGQLYLQLCQAVLARLDTVAGLLPEAARMPPYVLFLVDGRPRDERLRKALSLARLQSELLRELEGSAVGRRLGLRVAHGHGTGSSPLLPTPSAPARVDLSVAAELVWPATATPIQPKQLPLLRTRAHFGLESIADAEKRQASPSDWKTASRRGVLP